MIQQYGYVIKNPNGSEIFITTAVKTITSLLKLEAFRGPVINKIVPGLNVIVILSSDKIRIGEELWIRILLAGEKADKVNTAFLTVINFKTRRYIKLSYGIYSFPHHHCTQDLGREMAF